MARIYKHGLIWDVGRSKYINFAMPSRFRTDLDALTKVLTGRRENRQTGKKMGWSYHATA